MRDSGQLLTLGLLAVPWADGRPGAPSRAHCHSGAQSRPGHGPGSGKGGGEASYRDSH